MKKKIITAAMLTALVLFLLSGCRNQAETKVLKIATNCAFPPYEFYENEEPVGIDVEIIEAVASRMGYTTEFTDMEFGSIIPAVQTGRADVGFGAVTITEERSKNVHFTTSYSTGLQSVITSEKASIASIDDLYGDEIRIGVQKDTTGDIYATGDFGEVHIIRYMKGAEAVQDLIAGKIDAVIIDDSPARTFVSQNDGLILLPAAYAEEAYGFMFSYDNNDLYNEFNRNLEAMLADGSVQKIVDKYINDVGVQ